MLQRQRAVPFAFDIVHPPDIEGWAKVCFSSLNEGEIAGRDDSDTVDDHSERVRSDDGFPIDPAADESWAGQREIHFQTPSGLESGICLQAPMNSNRHALLGGRDRCETKREKCSVEEEWSRARGALANVAKETCKLSGQTLPTAKLSRLTQLLCLLEHEVEAANCASHPHLEPNDRLQPDLEFAASRSCDSNSNQADDAACEDAMSEVSDSSSDTPETLSEYFVCKSEVNVLQDRITELLFAMAERATDESPSSDTGLDRADAEEPRMQVLLEAVCAARMRADDQLAICLAQGLDPEKFRYRRSSGTSERISDAEGDK